ncbi:hypothetical protein HOG48_05565 [Candidatus Peregrinibacteria bacterium]|jgi:hypothetical protein|nr:hypothetical protein [Candidatus Peregrinibacteria bacterium]
MAITEGSVRSGRRSRDTVEDFKGIGRVKAVVAAYKEASDANPDDTDLHLSNVVQLRDDDWFAAKPIARFVRDALGQEVLDRRTSAAKEKGLSRVQLVKMGALEDDTTSKSTVELPEYSDFSIKMLEIVVGRLLEAAAKAKESGGKVEIPLRELKHPFPVTLTGMEVLPAHSNQLIGIDQSDCPDEMRIPAEGTLVIGDFSMNLKEELSTRGYGTLFELLMAAAINKGCCIEVKDSLGERPFQCFVRQMRRGDCR